MEPEGAAGPVTRGVRDERVARRASHALADAVGDPHEEHVPGVRGEGNERTDRARQPVAEEHQRLSPGHDVRNDARGELGQARYRVGRPLDQAEIRGPGLQRLGQEKRKQRENHLRADIREEAREAEEDDRRR
jgi:hypothetical protein